MKEDSPMPDVPKPTTVWRRKEIPNNEDCRITLISEECKEEDEWYIDSGFSSHMTGDQNKFISLNRKGGNVAFGDDSSTKILGKGLVKLGSENVKEKNVLLVEYLKHNLLSVSKMCDQGYTLMFDSRRCKIREEGSGRLVATATRRPSNIYILDQEKRKKIEDTQKTLKEEKDQKTGKKNEVLLSAICSGDKKCIQPCTKYVPIMFQLLINYDSSICTNIINYTPHVCANSSTTCLNHVLNMYLNQNPSSISSSKYDL
jgi:hypothetical protein